MLFYVWIYSLITFSRLISSSISILDHFFRVQFFVIFIKRGHLVSATPFCQHLPNFLQLFHLLLFPLLWQIWLVHPFVKIIIELLLINGFRLRSWFYRRNNIQGYLGIFGGFHRLLRDGLFSTNFAFKLGFGCLSGAIVLLGLFKFIPGHIRGSLCSKHNRLGYIWKPRVLLLILKMLLLNERG